MNDEIARFSRAVPFAAFEIELVTGRTLAVPHPEFVYAPPGRSQHIVWTDAGGTTEWINTTLVVAVRPIGSVRKQPRRKRAG